MLGKGLEYYSSVLWHLKKEVDLAYLAQEVSSLDRRSPFTWLVVGNCFSLQKVRSLSLHSPLCVRVRARACGWVGGRAQGVRMFVQ